MNENQTYEFVVARKKEGKYKLQLILGHTAVIGTFLMTAIVFLAFKLFWFVAILFPLIPVGMYVWKLFSQELEYSMTSGIMTFTVIYGGLKRKKKLELTIKDFREIAPYDDAACAHLESMGLSADHRFFSSPNADDVYYAVFENDGKREVVYFEATQRALQILRFYNSDTVVTKVSR